MHICFGVYQIHENFLFVFWTLTWTRALSSLLHYFGRLSRLLEAMITRRSMPPFLRPSSLSKRVLTESELRILVRLRRMRKWEAVQQQLGSAWTWNAATEHSSHQAKVPPGDPGEDAQGGASAVSAFLKLVARHPRCPGIPSAHSSLAAVQNCPLSLSKI